MNIEKLINIADALDKKGLHEEANKVDEYIQKLSQNDPMEYTIPGETPREDDTIVDSIPGVFRGEDTKVDFKPMPEDSMAAEKTTLNENVDAETVRHHFEVFLESPRSFENINTLKKMIDKYVSQQLLKEVGAMSDVFSGLTAVADDLDGSGLTKAADMIDDFIGKYADDVVDWKEEADTPQSKRYDTEYHKDLLVDQPKPSDMKQDLEGRKQQYSGYDEFSTVALSTRHCPNHVGAQLGRIGENTYQCSYDGEIFNWETGWTDHEGNQHPGSSVAAQTPDATPYGVGHRVFDSRQHIINRVN